MKTKARLDSQLSFRLTKPEHEVLVRLAREAKVSESEIVRQALRAEAERRGLAIK